MHRTYFLASTALMEGSTGLLLFVSPTVLAELLLGVAHASPEVAVVARIAGAALLALAVACWFGRTDHRRPAQQGLLLGVLIYDLGAAGILAYAGWFLNLVGFALWPAVALHSGLAVWGVSTFKGNPRCNDGTVTPTNLLGVESEDRGIREGPL
jgi:hypothetical protein